VREAEWKGRRVLVTGAGGFVGSWLAAALADRGANVVCLLLERDQGRPTNLERLGIADRVRVVWGDLVDLTLLQRLLAEHGTDSCFHLAAQAIVGTANESPLPTFEANVCGTWNLLEACRAAGHLERVVVASSDKAYGDQERLPYTEDLPLRAVFPYDVSKACADLIARSYARTYGLPVAVTRMANIYGGGDFNFSRIVPGTVRSVLLGEDPIVRSDGTPVRDYLYVEDAVEAYLLLGSRLPEEALAGEAFNFGTRSPVNVLELVDEIIGAAGRPDVQPRILGEGRLHGEIDRQFLDSSKAEAALGWRAATTLPQGLSRTVEWYRRHLDQVAE